MDLFDRPIRKRPELISKRPMLVAMNNPLSDAAWYALYPAPVGCAGHRLWRMLAETAEHHGDEPITRQHYIEAFDRRNVLSAREWSAAEARRAAGALRTELRGRVVGVLGVATLKALRLPRHPWGKWVNIVSEDLRYVLLPHPSGRCHEYNDPEMRRMAGETLLLMYRAFRQRSGEAIIIEG